MNGSEMDGRRQPLVSSAQVDDIAHVAAQVDRLCWTGILLGLAFTMTNVQQFAAAGSPPWSLTWLAAWLLDPMVSLVLLAILRAEQVTAHYRIRTHGWVRGAKWFTLAATYVMNTWSSFTAGSPAQVVLHSVPPLVVFVAAEAVTELREKLGAAIAAAYAETTPEAADDAERADLEPTSQLQHSASSDGKNRRVSFGEYLDAARAARTPDVTVTPAWVREVTGCSRGLSSRLAATLRDESEVRP